MNPVILRQRANTQNVGAKAEAKLKTQQRHPQMNRGYFLPNLSDMLLTKMLPIKNPRKITEVEMNPNEPRSQTSSNCGISCKNIEHYRVHVDVRRRGHLFSLAVLLPHFGPCDDTLENSRFQIFK